MGLANQQRSLEDRKNWLGGMIDGEGMITVIRRADSRSWAPRISVVNTNLEIFQEIIDILNNLGLPHYVQRKTYTTSSGRVGVKLEITFSGFKRCSKILPIIIPTLVGKRRKAELLLNWCNYRLSHPPKVYTDKDTKLISLIRETPLDRSQTARRGAITNCA